MAAGQAMRGVGTGGGFARTGAAAAEAVKIHSPFQPEGDSEKL